MSLTKLKTTLLISLLLIAGVGITRIALFALSPLHPGFPSATLLEIHKGQSPRDIVKLLASNGAIEDSKGFLWLGRLTRQWGKIKAGEYKVSPAMSPVEIFSILTSGISIAHPLTVREGENMYEVADDLAGKGLASKEHFLYLCKDPNFIKSLGWFHEEIPSTLEGFLFPDTYFFNKSLSAADMIKQMTHHFFDFWGERQKLRSKELHLSALQLITLASIIEKETGAPEERALISSVFHNRLQKKMRLQSDPTTIYGMWERYKGKIHKSDLTQKNAYNTYMIDSLPIGPIGNPGRDAIQAALFPAESAYLYFVSHNDGTHQFSRTLGEHNNAVKKFQLDPKARQGKSWRDHLNKRPASVSK